MSYEVANNGVVREPTNDVSSFEVRVWCEDGTLMGYAMVYSDATIVADNGASFRVAEADENSGYYWFAGESQSFTHTDAAELYAREWAEGYADWCREYCTCGTGDCGAMFEHGISIQYCRDGWTLGEGD